MIGYYTKPDDSLLVFPFLVSEMNREGKVIRVLDRSVVRVVTSQILIP